MSVEGGGVVVIWRGVGGRGADWGTLSKPALEIPFVDVVVPMHQ